MGRTILFNADAVTMNEAEPRAQLICVEEDRILFAGGHAKLDDLKRQEDALVDCSGLALIPGFIDAHCHLFAYAEHLLSLDLSPRADLLSLSDMQHIIASDCAKKPPGTWIRGKGYDEFRLAEKRHPNRRDLDAAAPSHPVKLTHRSGHAHVLNSLALKKARIAADTGDPPGGLIERDPATGEPTGLLFGMGQYLSGRVPPLGDSELEGGMRRANDKLLSCGITSIQDASSANDLSRVRRLEDWKKREVLNLRVSMMMGLKGFIEAQPHPPGLKPGTVKIIADQVTGSLHPAQEELNSHVAAIHDADFQAAIHAVEEPVIEAACTAIELALKRRYKADHRHRIEHCSLCPPSLQKRLAADGICVVTQPAFIYCSGDRYLGTVPGQELEHLYPAASLRDCNVRIAFSSDFPIADPNPLVGIQAAVTRKSEKGARVSPRQSISVSQALYMYTMGAASANFEEGIKGSLEPGKFADIVALSENPITANPECIKDIRVVWTMIGGRVYKF